MHTHTTHAKTHSIPGILIQTHTLTHLHVVHCTYRLILHTHTHTHTRSLAYSPTHYTHMHTHTQTNKKAAYIHDFLFPVCKAVCQKVHRLHFSDGVFLNCRLEWIQWSNLRLVTKAVLERGREGGRDREEERERKGKREGRRERGKRKGV